MKYGVGDRVRIKSIDWYNENKDKMERICFKHENFIPEMSQYCGKILTIKQVEEKFEYYLVSECGFAWADEMIEGIVKEENNDCKKCSSIHNSTKCLFMDNCPHNKQKNIIEIPKDYVLKDENGNIINATKIVLEKKKKEYPKTYEECVNELDTHKVVAACAWEKEMKALQTLFVCRDAYRKIAGEELGLGKPWKPDWNNISDKYCIYFVSGDVWTKECQTRRCLFAFPTPEMRDAFYENFKEEIEICRELL